MNIIDFPNEIIEHTLGYLPNQEAIDFCLTSPE
jgi:hypothetical protein